MWHDKRVGQQVWHTPCVTDHNKALAAAAAQYRGALDILDDARAALTAAIRAAHDDKVRQVDILKATDRVWTREQVRRVCRRDEP